MSKKARITPLCIILVLSIIAFLIYSSAIENINREKINITVLANSDTTELFKDQFDSKGEFHDYYNYEFSSSKSSDIILTSDINSINTDLNYTSAGLSPLVICFKNTEKLNKYLKSNSSNGFLICNNSDKIRNNDNDDVSCDFLQVINTVIEGKNWSSLGEEEGKKITLYCPNRDTVDGELFYKFLLITLNNGKYPDSNLEEISQKADAFYNSPSVLQVDVSSKISKLGSSISENEIYCIFEADLLNIASKSTDICVTYPLTTVSKHVYLQINNNDIKDSIMDAFNKDIFNVSSITKKLYWSNYYRTSDNLDWKNYEKNYSINLNVRDGFNEYELFK